VSEEVNRVIVSGQEQKKGRTDETKVQQARNGAASARGGWGGDDGGGGGRHRRVCRGSPCDPEYKIQYHVLQHLGADWASSGANKKTEELVKYASDVVKGGGVITFDIGMSRADGKGPYLEMQPDQFAQLKAVSAALKDIPASDGSGK
jgi:hypothetical protein